MFFRGIDELESTFKTFDRLNSVVFNVWRDKAAETYKNGDIARITNEYRNYISQIRSLAQEANKLYSELRSKEEQIRSLSYRTCSLGNNPPIDGCNIYNAKGLEAVYYDDGSVHHYNEISSVNFVGKSSQVWAHEKEYAARFVGYCDDIEVRLIKNL
jgi:hypothetical protein